MALNESWHHAHPMPPRATERQRAAWHLGHARECGCREIPPSLLVKMRAWGMVPEPEEH